MVEKLVRDKIPEILKEKDEKFELKIANDTEYWKLLKKKLEEEVKEFLESENTEELADILEVIYAICKFKGIKIEDIERIRKEKLEKYGGFEKRYIIKK